MIARTLTQRPTTTASVPLDGFHQPCQILVDQAEDPQRTEPYDAMGIPWILNQDDLLSLPYRPDGRDTRQRTKTFSDICHVISGRAFAGFSHHAEAGNRLARLARDLWTGKALCTSLRTFTETANLAARTERRVFCMPSVRSRKIQPDHLSDRPISAVFTGGLTYQPNLDTLRTYGEKFLPIHATRNWGRTAAVSHRSLPGISEGRSDTPAIRFWDLFRILMKSRGLFITFRQHLHSSK
jgi:hypothetical protein